MRRKDPDYMVAPFIGWISPPLALYAHVYAHTFTYSHMNTYIHITYAHTHTKKLIYLQKLELDNFMV